MSPPCDIHISVWIRSILLLILLVRFSQSQLLEIFCWFYFFFPDTYSCHFFHQQIIVWNTRKERRAGGDKLVVLPGLKVILLQETGSEMGVPWDAIDARQAEGSQAQEGQAGGTAWGSPPWRSTPVVSCPPLPAAAVCAVRSAPGISPDGGWHHEGLGAVVKTVEPRFSVLPLLCRRLLWGVA